MKKNLNSKEYKEYLSKAVPILGMSENPPNGAGYGRQVWLENRKNLFDQEWEKKTPYVKAVWDFVKKKEDIGEITVIKSGDKNSARKAAAILMDLAMHLDIEYEYDDGDGRAEFYYETPIFTLEEEKQFDRIVYLDMEKLENSEEGYQCAFDDLDEDDTLILDNVLNGVDMGEKLNAIEDARQSYKVILQYDGENPDEDLVDFIEVPECDDTYYAGFLDGLLPYCNDIERIHKFPKGGNFHSIISRCRRKFGDDLCEEKMAEFFFSNEALEMSPIRSKTLEKVQKMTGMGKFKECVESLAAIEMEKTHNPKLGRGHFNCVFCGNPGTGKTTGAEKLAAVKAEVTGTRKIFFAPARSELIGKYVGQTSPLILNAFAKARNGVLFVDEAGFLLQKRSGGYVEEAIKEFVRLMDLYPDVTVIFALYKGQMQRFLDLDPGLASRISWHIDFSDYTYDELKKIAEDIAKDNGYDITNNAIGCMNTYLGAQRKKKNFGNAREVRRLVEASIKQAAQRHLRSGRYDLEIRLADVKAAIPGLNPKESSKAPKRIIGFDIGESIEGGTL